MSLFQGIFFRFTFSGEPQQAKPYPVGV